MNDEWRFRIVLKTQRRRRCARPSASGCCRRRAPIAPRGSPSTWIRSYAFFEPFLAALFLAEALRAPEVFFAVFAGAVPAFARDLAKRDFLRAALFG